MKHLLTLLILISSFCSNAQSAATFVQNGKNKTAAKDYDGAIQEFTYAAQKLNREIELHPGTNRSNLDVIFSAIYSFRAIAKQKKLDYTGAMEDYNLAISKSPYNDNAYEGRGSLKHELKDYTGAIADFNTAIEISPPGSESVQSLLALSKQQLALESAKKQSASDEEILKMFPGLKTPSGTGMAGKPAPGFSQTDKKGRLISLSSFKGKYVLLNFWASSSAPSLAENANIEAAYQKYKNKNLVVIGISLDKNREQWLNAIATCNPSWIQLSDLKGWDNAVAKLYNIFSTPQIILIGPDGKIITDNLRGAEIESALKSKLK